MKLAFVVVVVVCGVTFGSSTGEQYLDENDKVHANTAWNYLLLANQWPQTFCMLFRASNHSKPAHCRIPQNVNGWTIHGLWPTINAGNTPTYCNRSWSFQFNKIKDLVPALNTSWPNLIVGRFPFYNLWAYQWSKHGTCAANLPILRGEHNYFSSTLDLKNQFNIDSVLRNAGIVPSPTAKYSLKKIKQALERGTGALPTFSCFQYNNNQYLGEIRMCVNKNMHPIDCRSKSEFSVGLGFRTCSSKSRIALPPIAH